MPHCAVSIGCALKQQALLLLVLTQFLVAVKGLVPLLQNLVYACKEIQRLCLTAEPPLCEVQSQMQTGDGLGVFLRTFLAVSQLQVRGIQQIRIFRGFEFAFFDGLQEVLLRSLIHAGLSIEHTQVVEQVRAVYLWEVRVYLESLAVAVKAEAGLLEVRVAAAQVVVFLAELPEVLAFEAAAVILHSFLIVPESIVAVSHVEDHLLIKFERLAFSLEAFLQQCLFLLQGLKRLLEISHLIKRDPFLDATVLLLPHYFLTVVALTIAVLSETLAVVEARELGVGPSLGNPLSERIFYPFLLAFEDQSKAFKVRLLQQLLDGIKDIVRTHTAEVNDLAGFVHRRLNLEGSRIYRTSVNK